MIFFLFFSFFRMEIFFLSNELFFCICVFVCICIFVYALLTHGNIIFDILEQSSFQKYTTWWVFLALCHMLYLCICVFVCLCICVFVFGLGRSLLDQFGQKMPVRFLQL